MFQSLFDLYVPYAQWMESRQSPTCPVCKAVISKDKLIPLYGRGSENKDPRENVPPRPQGEREEAPEEEEVGVDWLKYRHS